MKSLATGLPLDPRFRTKGQMAIDILGDARCRRPHLDFVCAWLATASLRHSLLVRHNPRTADP
jgi:hypothetical protein